MKNNIQWKETSRDEAFLAFAKNKKVKCTVNEKDNYTFNPYKSPYVITLNSKLILHGKWFVEVENEQQIKEEK